MIAGTGTKRGRIEVYLDVLNTIREGEHKPTRIMYKANLSWNRMTQIFDNLLKQETIKETKIQRRNVYNITQKGIRILDYYKNAELEISK